ncbi:MAG: hypothetical protein KAR19_01315 [Bacteroidales bacterium]|nr:hypothetical protein [Bacteroidales bacterium]
MKRNIIFTTITCIIIFLFSGIVFSQEEEEDNRPIRPPFETVTLIDNQTTVNLEKGAFLLEIQHRFSQIKEIADLFGIYGSANTRLGLGYGVTDKIQLGFGTTRDYMLQDLEWKYSILTQTRSGRIPVSLSYYGNTVLDARDSKYFGPEEDYKFIYRLSYLNQLIVSRNFGGWGSFMLAPTFVYYNAVKEGYNNANASIYFGGRIQVLGMNSIVFEYDQPLLMPDEEIYPNMALGIEVGTSTHAFRVFVSNYNAIVKNRSIAFNGNNPFDGDFQFGFNISIRF